MAKSFREKRERLGKDIVEQKKKKSRQFNKLYANNYMLLDDEDWEDEHLNYYNYVEDNILNEKVKDD